MIQLTHVTIWFHRSYLANCFYITYNAMQTVCACFVWEFIRGVIYSMCKPVSETFHCNFMLSPKGMFIILYMSIADFEIYSIFRMKPLLQRDMASHKCVIHRTDFALQAYLHRWLCSHSPCLRSLRTEYIKVNKSQTRNFNIRKVSLKKQLK